MTERRRRVLGGNVLTVGVRGDGTDGKLDALYADTSDRAIQVA